MAANREAEAHAGFLQTSCNSCRIRIQIHAQCLEYVGRAGLGLWKGPIETLSTPPGATLNLVMIAAASVMLLLSLRPHRSSEAAARRAAGIDNEARA